MTSEPRPSAIREKFGDAIADKYDELLAAHGEDLRVWCSKRTGLVAIALHPNAQAEYERMLDSISQKGGASDTGRALARRVFAKSFVVHPDERTVARIFAASPAFVVTVADAAEQLCEGDFEDLGKL
jgi:hypothetical protein